MLSRRVVAALVFSPCLLPLASCDPPPQQLDIAEVRRSDLSRLISSGSTVRWEGEDVYYFTGHDPGPGFRANPYSFFVILSAVPGGLEVAGEGGPWPRVDFGTAGPTNRPSFAYTFSTLPWADPEDGTALRSQLWFGPAAGPMVVDHGKTYSLMLTDRGADGSGKAPTTRALKFAYVQRGRCTVREFAAVPADPAENATFAVSVNVADSCKYVAVTEKTSSGTATVLMDSFAPGLGAPFTGTVQRLRRAGRTEYRVAAYDAAGMVAAADFSIGQNPAGGVATTLTTTPTDSGGSGGSSGGSAPAPACPGNPNGAPRSITLCASCPAGAKRDDEIPTRRPTLHTFIGDWCSVDDAKQDLANGYGTCAITEGACN